MTHAEIELPPKSEGNLEREQDDMMEISFDTSG